jgi:hypothetical protein
MSYATEIFIQLGLDTDVAYTSGEFRGKDGWMRVPVEVRVWRWITHNAAT